ncbi:hypothetical protein WA158_004285 [Blastocystis sp. Blastoise]
MSNNYLSTLTSVISGWKSWDIRDEKYKLHEELNKITLAKNASVEKRKEVVRKNKGVGDFRGLMSDDKFIQLTQIIKSYQEYVDDLTVRSQFSEDIILRLSGYIDRVTDPCSILEESQAIYKSYNEVLGKVETYEIESKELKQIKDQFEQNKTENIQLKDKINNIQNELMLLKSQNTDNERIIQQYKSNISGNTKKDIYIKKLEDQNNNYIQQIDQLKKEIQEQEKNSEALKRSENITQYQNQIDLLNNQLHIYERDKEKEIEERKVVETTFKDKETEYISRIEALQKNNLLLTQELDTVSLKYNIRDETPIDEDVELLSSVKVPDQSIYKENLLLLEEVDSLKKQLSTCQKEKEEMVSSLNSQHEIEISGYINKINEYQRQLKNTISLATYKKLQRVFTLLQQSGYDIEFSNDQSVAVNTEITLSNTEKLLIKKIEALQNHNIELRQKYEDLNNIHSKSNATILQLTERERDLTQLVNKLETQIAEEEQPYEVPSEYTPEDPNDTSTLPTPSTKATLSINASLSGETANSNTINSNTITSVTPITNSSTNNSRSSTPLNSITSSQRLEIMLKEQRDRYKKQADELELENTQYKNQIQHLLTQIEQTSNIKNRNFSRSKHYTVSINEDIELSDSHKNYYSHSIHGSNPFERLVISLIEECLNNKHALQLLIIYLFIIHLLIIFLLFHMSTRHM